MFFFFAEERTKFTIYRNKKFNPTQTYSYQNSFIHNYYYKGDYLSFYNFSFNVYVKYEVAEDKMNYNFYDYSSVENSIEINEITNNNYSVNFCINFGYAKNINYTLILSDIKNKEFFKSKISIYENFYLKSQYNNSDFEFHNFTQEDLMIISGINASIEIQNSQKFNFSKQNQEYIITIIIQMGPPEMVFVFTPKIYKTYKESEDNEDNEDNNDSKDNESKDSNKTKTILIILGIFFLIVIIIVIVIIFVKKKKEISINSLDQGFNISMADESLKQ